MKNLVIIISLFVTACMPKPYIAGMGGPPTDGTGLYRQGWKDGCQTGKGSYSNDYLRAIYPVKVVAELMEHKDYQRGWNLGNDYCKFYVSKYLSMGVDEDPHVSLFGKGEPGDDFREPLWGNYRDVDAVPAFGGISLLGWDGDKDDGPFMSSN